MNNRRLQRKDAANFVSKVARKTGLSSLGYNFYKRINNSHIRVVNYHHIPIEGIAAFERQLDVILSRYDPVEPDEVIAVINGSRNTSKPGVLFTFDDGLESQATHAADILSKRGVTACFFVPTAAPDIPLDKQAQWAIDHEIIRTDEDISTNGRVFASWDTWRSVSANHIVASHTHDHLRFRLDVNRDQVDFQLNTSFQRLRDELGIERRFFCYVGGELGSYSPQAAQAIAALDIELAFTTCSSIISAHSDHLRVERTNVEWHFNDDRVLLALSGIVDIRYALKRHKLNKVFSVASGRAIPK